MSDQPELGKGIEAREFRMGRKNLPALSSGECQGLQTGLRLDRLCDALEFVRAQSRGPGLRRGPRDGVGVDFLDLSSGPDDSIQARAVGVQFRRWHRLAMRFEKETLNDNRTHARGPKQI